MPFPSSIVFPGIASIIPFPTFCTTELRRSGGLAHLFPFQAYRRLPHPSRFSKGGNVHPSHPADASRKTKLYTSESGEAWLGAGTRAPGVEQLSPLCLRRERPGVDERTAAGKNEDHYEKSVPGIPTFEKSRRVGQPLFGRKGKIEGWASPPLGYLHEIDSECIPSSFFRAIKYTTVAPTNDANNAYGA